MKKILAMLLLLSLPVSLAACSKQENASDTAETIDSSENIPAEDDETETIPEELTMELLLELYENNMLATKVETEGLDGFLKYENLKLQEDVNEESLTGLYSCSLSYPHEGLSVVKSEERTYEFQLYYWKPETAEEYGHEKNEIDDILLMEKETGDAVLLYNSDSSYTPTDNLEGFLQKEYGLEQYLTVSLPDGYAFGRYTANAADFPGWLLEGDMEEPIHGDWTPLSWYAPGGIERAQNGSDILRFEDGALTDATLLVNHSVIISEAEPVEGCEVPAVLTEYAFDLFTAPEWDEYLKNHPDAKEEERVSRYWYVFMGREDSDTYYILFLNEKLFSKEDAVQAARSIHFTEHAF